MIRLLARLTCDSRGCVNSETIEVQAHEHHAGGTSPLRPTRTPEGWQIGSAFTFCPQHAPHQGQASP